MFDDGYEAYREWVLPRMIERGILPEGTELTPINPMPAGTFGEGDAVRPWDSLSDEEKALFCRMAEVYAGFSEYTDAQVGRIVDYLEESGQLDNTIVFYCADNGASGEGSPNGSVNENKFFNAYPDDIEENLAMIDRLGSPDTYNHYPTGWAVALLDAVPDVQALRVPGRRVRPAGDPLAGGDRGQGRGAPPVPPLHRHRPDDPRLLRRAVPDVVQRRTQNPLAGVSMRYSFDAADAPTQKVTQYYEMLGHRGIWHEGWKAVTEHGPVPTDRQLRQRPLAAVPHRRGPRRGPRRRRRAPGEGRGAEGAVDARRPRS